jgi:hypothetical protein
VEDIWNGSGTFVPQPMEDRNEIEKWEDTQ